jgi:ubiquinone/menaquinone biosynthesis C-methylase UbiE
MSMAPTVLESCPAACKPSGILRQFENPKGWLGWCIGQLMAIKNRQRSEWVIDLMNVQPRDRILEAGFGSGVDIARTSALAWEGFVAGLDHSEAMVRQAQRRNTAAIQAGQVELRRAEASAIPYPDASFDKAFSINVAQFWADPLVVLAELRRVLVPGGLVAIAIQPRISNATEVTSQQTGQFLVNALIAAGFEQVRLETKPMQPVSVVCALGFKQKVQ